MPDILFAPQGNPSSYLKNLPHWFTAQVNPADLYCRALANPATGNPQAQIADAFQSYSRLIKSLHKLRTESRSRRRTAMRIVLDAQTPRIVHLYKEVHDNRSPLRPRRKWTPRAIIDEALGINPYAGLLGGIDVSYEDARGCRQRQVFRLNNVLDVALHKLVLALHRALEAPHPRQFAARGNGGDPAFKSCLRVHLPGKSQVITSDIASCFMSLCHDRLRSSLLLPERVSNALIIDPTMGKCGKGEGREKSRLRTSSRGAAQWLHWEGLPLDHTGSCAEALENGSGVLPGMPLSALAAEMVTAPIIEAIEASVPGAIAMTHVDDLLVLTDSEGDQERVAAAIAAAGCSALSAPSLVETLRRVESFDPRSGFEFIGYTIRLRGGQVRFEQNPQAREHAIMQMISEAYQRPERFDELTLRQRILGHVQRYDDGADGQALRMYADLQPHMRSRPNPFDFEQDAGEKWCGSILYCDGSCSGSQGPGGWAAVIQRGSATLDSSVDGIALRFRTPLERLTGGAALTTNNRMELMAAVEGLRTFPDGARVLVMSDSRYVVDNARSHLIGWAEARFRRPRGKRVANADLWMALLEQVLRLDVRFRWVKAHSGVRLNEMADRMAREAMRKYSERNLFDIGANSA